LFENKLPMENRLGGVKTGNPGMEVNVHLKFKEECGHSHSRGFSQINIFGSKLMA